MKIVYLYIDGCGALQNRELSFVSEYKCHFSGSVLFVQRGKPQLNGFFSTSANAKKSNVICSAVVGENGTGKTSVALAIYNLVANASLLGKFVAIMEVDGGLRVYYGGMARPEIVADDGIPMECRENDDRSHFDMALHPFTVFYYSPVFTSQRVVCSNGNEFVDISTTGLLEELPEKFINEGSPSAYGVYQTASLNACDTLWTLQFVLELHRRFSDSMDTMRRELDMSLPTGCLLISNERSLGPVLKDLERWSSVGRRTPEFLRKVFQFDYANDAFIRVFICYAGNFLRSANLSQIPVEWEHTYSFRLLRFAIALYQHLHDRHPSDDIILPLHGRILQFFICAERIMRKLSQRHQIVASALARIADARKFFEYLFMLNSEIDGRAIAGMSAFGANFETESQRKKLLAAIESYEGSKLITDYVVFKFTPPLSSGEMAFLTMWGRLYHALQRQRTECSSARPNWVLFLDEAETALHPRWQRLLVYGMIWFCERFFPDAHVHLIFASHSPVLLSDMPRGHVVALGMREKRSTGRAKLKRGVRPFAATIACLYRDVYDLADGPYGILAQSKLEALFENHRHCSKGITDSNLRCLIDEIGDKLMRFYLKGTRW